MDNNRKIAREKLTGIKKFMEAGFEEKQKGRIFKGKELSLNINGQKRLVMSYGESKEPAPAYFDIHGGGFAWGTIRDGDEWCALLAEKMSYKVFSLDYPLSPENEYPSQIEYLYETIDHIRKNPDEFGIDPNCLFIGGRSAGANLAAALCIYAIEKGEFTFGLQVLDHPWLDVAFRMPWDGRCSVEGTLPLELMEILAYGYSEKKYWDNPLISPLYADPQTLSGMPAAVIQTAEIDSLEPEGARFAQLLRENGASVEFRQAKGVTHGFTEEYTPEAEEGRQWLLLAVQKLLEQEEKT